MNSRDSGLSRRERQVMNILYRLKTATVAEVQGEIDDRPHNSTVRALLRVLERKGHIRHYEQHLRYVYAPVVPIQELPNPLLRKC
jgi:BlaI family penicillinase repressor